MNKKNNKQQNIYPEIKARTWDDLKYDDEQKNIYKENAKFVAKTVKDIKKYKAINKAVRILKKCLKRLK